MMRAESDRVKSLSLTYSLAQAHRQLHGELEEALQSENVTVEQWRVLDCLGQQGGQPMGQLAHNVLMNHPALTKLADRMVANGLIYRVADPEDQRRVLMHISNQGVSRLEHLQRLVLEHDRKIETMVGESKSAALKALLQDLTETEAVAMKRPKVKTLE